MADTRCRHCGERIVRTKFLDRDTWTHQPAGAAFRDGQHHYCELTVAAPTDAETEMSSGGFVKVVPGPASEACIADFRRGYTPLLADRLSTPAPTADLGERAAAQSLAPVRLLVRTWKAENKNGPVWALVLRELDAAIKAGELRTRALMTEQHEHVWVLEGPFFECECGAVTEDASPALNKNAGGGDRG